MSDQANNFLALPLDIHALIVCHLSPSDILKLRTVSEAAYTIFTSPVICRSYLVYHGFSPESPSAARLEFDRYCIPQGRTANGHPTKAVVVDGVRLSENDAPYFTKSHVFTTTRYEDSLGGVSSTAGIAGDAGREGVVIYRTTGGDLAFQHLSDASKSAVLLLAESLEFTTQSLAAYNRGGGKAAIGSGNDVKEKGKGKAIAGRALRRLSLGGAKAKVAGMRMQRFDINVHDDFGGEVALVELSWGYAEANEGFEESSNHQFSTPWHDVINRKVNLGVVISVAPDTLGQPVAAFTTPKNFWPWSEYVLNKHYIAGINTSKQEFIFLRYAREDMGTVCALHGTPTEAGLRKTWSLPEYLPPVISMRLDSLGLVDFQCNGRGHNSNNAYNLDIHIQPDRAGELVFIITGAGVTAYNIDNVSRFSGPTVARSYWWRQRQMDIFLPNCAREHDWPWEDTSSPPVKHQEEFNRSDNSPKRTGERKIIGPSIPRIWKSYLPGKSFGGGADDYEMFTVVRAFNHVVERRVAGPMFHYTKEVPPWQQPQFLVAWEIPVTRNGVEFYTPDKLNERLSISTANFAESSSRNKIRRFTALMENAQGIFPSRIMELPSDSMDSGWDGLTPELSEGHMIFSLDMPKMCFAKRDTHMMKPGWLAITKEAAVAQRDEYFALAWPATKNGFSVRMTNDGVVAVQRTDGKRDVVRVDWNKEVRCDRPYPRPAEKRSSGILGLFSVGSSKTPELSELSSNGTEALPTGDIHHVKVGENGRFFAYVVNTSLIPGQDGGHLYGGRRGGTLVIMRYD